MSCHASASTGRVETLSWAEPCYQITFEMFISDCVPVNNIVRTNAKIAVLIPN